MYISYDYYRIFYYVARYGSITHAAKLLLNSQPNLTRAIKTLESELGCPLFIRNNRGMALTSEGERLFDRVAVAMENIEAGEAEIIASRNMEKGSVYVAASELALHCALLPVLKAYRAQHPGHALYPFMLDGSLPLLQARKTAKTPYALVFGNEATGLPASFASLGQPVRIPQSDTIDSLNLSVAVSIAAYAFTQEA